MKTAQENFRLQRWISILSVILFIAKIIAYYLTHSLAILTDALEGIVNVLAGFIGLYSLYVAAKPRDFEHPYGHGKAEFVSAAAEGSLIVAAGLMILYETVIVSPALKLGNSFLSTRLSTYCINSGLLMIAIFLLFLGSANLLKFFN